MPTRHGIKVDRFYHSSKWIRCRDYIMKRDRGICVVCGMAGKIVHHKIPLTEDNVDDDRISINPDNLELLCFSCHKQIHDEIDSGFVDKPSLCEFDSKGNVIVHEHKKDSR